jgi:hypothetical protein
MNQSCLPIWTRLPLLLFVIDIRTSRDWVTHNTTTINNFTRRTFALLKKDRIQANLLVFRYIGGSLDPKSSKKCIKGQSRSVLIVTNVCKLVLSTTKKRILGNFRYVYYTQRNSEKQLLQMFFFLHVFKKAAEPMYICPSRNSHW